MTVLAVLLVSALFQSAPPDRCAQLYERTEVLRQQMVEEIQAQGQPTDSTLAQSAEYARRARQCYGTHRSDTVATLYQRELYALRRLRRSDEALNVADAFLDRFEGTGRPGQVAYVQQWRGRLYGARAKFKQALDAYTQALVSARKADQPAWKKAELYVNMAQLYREIDDFGAARQRYRQAADLLRTVSSTNTQNVRQLARVLMNQADLAILQADVRRNYRADSLTRAGAQALQAAKLYLRLNLTQSEGMAYVKAAEAYAYADRPKEALPYMQKAMRLGEETGNLALRSAAAYKIGRLRLQMRDIERAERLLDRALTLAEQRGDLDYQRRISIDRGLLHETQHQWDEAMRWYRRAARLTERYRASLGVTEWVAQASGNWYWQQPYRGQTRVLLRQDQPQAAFRVLEESRARHLRNLRRAASAMQQLPESQHARADSLLQALAAVRDTLTRHDLSSTRRSLLTAREVDLSTTLDDLLDVPADTSTFSVAHAQEALALRGRVLLSYFLDAKSTVLDRTSASYAFVVTSDTLQAVPLDVTADSVRAVTAEVNPLLGDTVASQLNAMHFDLTALHQLYETLYAPVRDYVPQEAPLAVIPDGPLFGFPFGLLVEEETAPYAYREAPFLLRRHPIATESSATLVAAPDTHQTPPLDVVALGRSRFASDSTSGRLLFRNGTERTLRSNALRDLPSVPRELKTLRTLFARTRTALNDEATESAFYDFMNQGRVVHLASHAVPHPTSPLQHAVVLSPSEDRPEDGILRLHELQRRHLAAPLVVLSGCNTARGTMRAGEGMASLQYGFRAMGAESLLATLWLVEDEATAQLMRSFYQHLREGQPKDVALQRAQLDYLAQAEGQAASPFFWAAPMLYGEARPLHLEPRRAGVFGKWKIGGLLLLLALGLFWWKRKRWFSA